MPVLLIISMLFPAFLGLGIYVLLKKKKPGLVELMIVYFIYVLAVNFACWVILSAFFGYGSVILDSTVFTVNFSIKYCALAGLFVLLFAAVHVYICNFWRLEIFVFKPQPQKELTRGRRRARRTATFVLLFLGVLVFFVARKILDLYGEVRMDTIMFLLTVPQEGANTNLFATFAATCLPPTVLIVAFFYFIKGTWNKNNHLISVGTRTRRLKFQFPFRHLDRFSVPITAVAFIGLALISLNSLGLNDVIEYYALSSEFIESHYVDPASVDLTFPDQKKNLIWIYVESMENSFTSKEYGGALHTDLIPNLRHIAEDNVSFSHNSLLGGPQQMYATGWTIGGIMAQTAGIPMILPIDGGNPFEQYPYYLPGAYALGDLLADAGYNQTFICGSDAGYAGRDTYFSQHGSYQIKDYLSAPQDGIIDEDYYNGWWGFEDEYLYEYAKHELTDLASQDAPFNLTLLTVDTHFTGGYTCNLCRGEYSDPYANVVACADRQIANFLDWLSQQDYYADTVIVITGDHISLDYTYIKANVDSSFHRTIYNAIINSAVQPVQTIARGFTPMDLYPTVVAAMGIQIPGDQLGLGVNLFSDSPTLLEQYGYAYFEEQLKIRSAFYNQKLLSLSE